jgi:hypothetical protein
MILQMQNQVYRQPCIWTGSGFVSSKRLLIFKVENAIMKKVLTLCFCLATFSLVAQKTSVFGKDFTTPEATEVWEPKPKIVTPGIGTAPPSDAIVLFNGTNMDQWVMSKDGAPSKWVLEKGVMTVKVGTGNVQTKQKFGDCQLHIEFKIPADAKNSADRNNAGNSGVFLQERYEVQIFNSYNNETPLYANGQTGSIYKQVIPMANASGKPGEWDSFDIFYTAPRFRFNGSLEKPAYVTLVHNGVLTLNHFEIHGPIQYIGIPKYELHDKASILLQGHGSAVSFRNIWIRDI